MNNTQRIERMRELLSQALQPSFLEIIDDSHKHVGHAGALTGMGHFTVKISSPQFRGLTLIQQHRLIYKTLGQLMTTEIHALHIEVMP